MRATLVNIHYLLLMLIAFVMPIYQKALPILVAALTLNWLVARIKLGFKQFHFKAFTIAIMCFYLLHVVGLLYSTDYDYALFDLEVKLSLFLLPLVIATSDRLERNQLRNILSVYVAGTGVAIAICLGISTYNYFTEKAHHYQFYGKYFSHTMHLSYFAMHINMAVCTIIYLLATNKRTYSRGLKIAMVILAMGYAYAVIMTSSKNGILTLFILLVLLGIYYIVKQRKWIAGGLALIFFAASFFMLLKWSPRTYYRFESAFQALFEEGEYDKTSTESTALRVFAWESAGKLIDDNKWIGVGTGDVKNELLKKYEELGYTGALEKNMNAHSQYLQTGVTLGYMGLALLAAIFLIPLGMALRQRRGLLVLFTLISIIYATNESIFEVQAGVLFFTFFATLLVYANELNNKIPRA